MARPGRRALRNEAVELALRARAAVDAPRFRGEVLAAYARLVPYDTAVFSEAGQPGPVTTVDVDGSALRLIQCCEHNTARYLPDLKPALRAAAREGGFVDHEIYSLHERLNLPLFAEISRPQGVRSTLMLTPRWRGTVLGFIRLERHGGTPFGRDDLRLATALLPTIELALMAFRAPPPTEDPQGLPGLTDREAEIARHVGRGLSNRHIALVLGTSPLTVRNQICRVFDKTGVASRAELAAWVARRTPPRN